MKKYDEKLRKYVSVEEYERTHQPRDKAYCRGKRPHDFILVLPYMVNYNEKYKFNPEEYYRMMDEQYDFIEKTKEKMATIGIVSHRGWNRREIRSYICTVCKKQKSEFID